MTALLAADAEPDRPPLENRTLTTTYQFPAKAGRRYGLRQMASMVPSVSHAQPDMQAVRQIAIARKRGFETLRAENRQIWADLWKGRIRLLGRGRAGRPWPTRRYFISSALPMSDRPRRLRFSDSRLGMIIIIITVM